jgi:hypothetical protein
VQCYGGEGVAAGAKVAFGEELDGGGAPRGEGAEGRRAILFGRAMPYF